MLMRAFASFVLACGLAAPAVLMAQGFPTKAVRITVPQAPGGASDALARIVGQKLAETWGQPVVIENRAGAGGNLGMETVAQAAPDGYTLLMSYVATQAINGALYKKLPFDPAKDFVPVATVATLPFVLVSRPNASFKTVGQLIEVAKTRNVTFGSAGNGSVNHLLGEMFNAAAGIKLTHVPYRGAAPALQDLMGGQIDVVFTSLPSVASHIKSGALQAIAVTSINRVPSFGSIPSIAEAGFKDFNVNPWFGFMAPKNTPRDLVARINKVVNEVLRDKDVVANFAAQGAEPYRTQPDEFAAVLHADVQKWGNVVRASGASVD